MDELVKLVTHKAGIPEAQAKQAVETVVGFLKEKLPAPLSGQIDNVLSGVKADDLSKVVDDAAKGLGGLLGRKQ